MRSNIEERLLNIGIFAHVDAGKTTVTENLLFQAGVIEDIGRVDSGNTKTDLMDLEKKRGISIQSTPISFDYKGFKVNLVDTPGHVDFIAEVERSMGILDGAVLVISAKEGVQSHTILLYNSLKKLKIPTVVLINKIDRMGVCLESVINQIKELLTEDLVPIQVVNSDMDIIDNISSDSEALIDQMTYYSDQLLESVINEVEISKDNLIESIKENTRSCRVHPLVYGSALHGSGMVELLDAIVTFLPSSTYIKEGKLSGVVFKIIRNKSNKRQIYIRLYEGTIRSRQWLGDEKVSFVKVLRNGELEYTKAAYGNDIIVIEGVDSLKVGDLIGEPKSYHPISLGEPTLRTYITADDKMALVECLNNIAESDPFLQYELEVHSGDISLNLFGEIQMEILQALLYENYHLEVEFTPPFIIYKEMPKGVGEYTLKIYTKEHPFYATVGLRVEPATSFSIASEVSTGFLPQRFQNGVIDGISSYLKEGLFGWELVNLKVTLIEGAFNSVDSTPADFRNLTPMVFFEALSLAKTKLLWPVNDFEIRVNNHEYGKVMSDLSVMQASDILTLQEKDCFRITGLLPLETSLNYEKKFISDTSGFGIFLTKFHGYLEAPTDIEKKRACNMISPLDRGNYLLSHLGTVNR